MTRMMPGDLLVCICRLGVFPTGTLNIGDMVVFLGEERDRNKTPMFVFVSRHGIGWRHMDPIEHGWFMQAST